MSLKPHERQMLAELVEAGHGHLDRYGRVCTGPISQPLTGSATAWLVLVAAGYVAGERGLILPTEDGRQASASYANGRVREAQA
jgi:hypothetical protein